MGQPPVKTKRKRRPPAFTRDPDLYERAFTAYAKDPTAKGVARAVGCDPSTAKRLIERGVPASGLPPISQKWKALISVAQQMDVDEGAKSIAIGRGMIRTAMQKMMEGLQGFRAANIPPAQFLPVMMRLIQYNEQISTPTAEQTAGERTEALEEFTLLMRRVAKGRLPGAREDFFEFPEGLIDDFADDPDFNTLLNDALDAAPRESDGDE